MPIDLGSAPLGRWRFDGMGELLLGHATVNHRGATIKSIDHLRNTLYRLVLGRSNAKIEKWRNENGLDLAGTFTTTFPHYKPFAGTPFQGQDRACEDDVKAGLTWLLEDNRGKLLAVSLNPMHLVARTVGNVTVDISGNGIGFTLEFKYEAADKRKPRRPRGPVRIPQQQRQQQRLSASAAVLSGAR
jgi:hypothetical protein